MRVGKKAWPSSVEPTLRVIRFPEYSYTSAAAPAAGVPEPPPEPRGRPTDDMSSEFGPDGRACSGP